MDLDIEQPGSLERYLRDHGHIGKDETVEIHRLDGGVSNRTMLVNRSSGESWVIKQALAKLRVKVDWFSDPVRIHREAMGMRWLHRLAPAGTITDVIFEDHDHHLLAMSAVPMPHENWKTMLLAGNVVQDHIQQFATLLGTIQVNAEAVIEEVADTFSDRSFFESLRLEPYYGYTATQVSSAAPFLEDLIRQTRERTITLVHGDYSPKNVLVRDGRVILLDHEVIHFGDGAFDVGFAMTHLLSKAHHVKSHRTQFIDAARMFWQTYYLIVRDSDWAVGMETASVRHTMGCLLARVAGRSPLEYLNASQRSQQQQMVLRLVSSGIERMEDLINEFNLMLASV